VEGPRQGEYVREIGKGKQYAAETVKEQAIIVEVVGSH
jgi:hypothetical protein